MPLTNQQQVEAWHKEWLEADAPHWGGRIDWSTADEIARRLDEAQEPEPESCLKAPPGRYCVLQAGHPGACQHYEVPA